MSATNGASAHDVVRENGEFIHIELNTSLRRDGASLPYVLRGLTNVMDWRPPTVTLLTNSDNATVSNGTVNFTCFVSDRNNVINVSLYVNSTGTWHLNQTQNINQNIFNVTFNLNLSAGAYSWNCKATDEFNNTKSGVTNFTLHVSDDYDITSPETIDLDAPVHQSNISISTINFNWTATDNLDTNLTCDLVIDAVKNQTNITSVSGETTNYSVEGFGEGGHLWNVTCRDDSNNLNTSITYNLTVDLTNPGITLDSPINLYNSSLQTVDFNFTVTDNIATYSTCDIYIDGAQNISEQSVLTGQTYNISVENLAEGTHYWNISCRDDANNTNMSIARDFTVDASLPVPWLNAPANNLNISTSTIRFNWTVIDNLDATLGCDLVVDGVVNVSNVSSTNNVLQNQDVNGFGEGAHLWNVTCRDSANNLNTSTTYNFIVDLTQPGAAGIAIAVSFLQFGSGYYDPNCTQGYSVLDSSGVNSSCWINTTAFLSNDTYHVIENTGTSVLNVTADTDQTDAQQLFCGAGGCGATSSAAVALESENNETAACTGGLTTPYATILDNTQEYLAGICNSQNYENTNDTIRVYYRLIIPKDAPLGAKTLTVTYEGIAV